MREKRKLSWDDLKRIVELKTIYIVIILFLIGAICLFLEYNIFSDSKDFIFKGVLSSMGITFITSSTVSFIMEIFLRLDIVDFMTQRMMAAMPDTIKGNTGVKEFYSDRKRIDFKEYWKKAESFIKIIGVSSNDILASANLPLIKERLAKDRDFYIQILLLTPWSVTAEVRSHAKVYKTPNEGIIKTHAVILDIQNFLKNIKASGIDLSRITLKLYDDIPSLSMVIDNKAAIVAPFMVVEQGGSSPYFVAEHLENVDGLYELYCNHFNTIWDTATTIHEGMDMALVYSQQRKKDAQLIQDIPDKYDDWILFINGVGNRG